MIPQMFPSRTMTIYLVKLFVTRCFGTLLMAILVLQALDLLGESDKILAHPGNGQAEILTYLGLRIPQLIQRFLPFAILLGTLFAFFTLNQNSEVISMKAAGLSAHQVLAPFMAASFVVAVLAFAFNERIVSHASAQLNRWEAVNFGTMPTGHEGETNVWVRNGDDLIHADFADGRGAKTKLTHVTIFDRSGGTLSSIVTGDTAVPSGAGWALANATRFDIGSGVRQALGSLQTLGGVRPDQFTLSSVDPMGLSYWRLDQAIADLDAAGRNTAQLKASLMHKISGPLSTALMPLLAAVAAFGLARSGRGFVRAVIGMALGFAYFVADNFGLAMGNLGAYPPYLAAWGPFVLFLLIGETVLIRTEE